MSLYVLDALICIDHEKFFLGQLQSRGFLRSCLKSISNASYQVHCFLQIEIFLIFRVGYFDCIIIFLLVHYISWWPFLPFDRMTFVILPINLYTVAIWVKENFFWLQNKTILWLSWLSCDLNVLVLSWFKYTFSHSTRFLFTCTNL